MLRGLHIEMTDWEALGKWLDSSGWTAALVQADVAAPGKADSFIKPSHVSETRHAHQATAAALYTLLQKAYTSYVEEHNDHPGNFDEWSQLKEDENPQFKFWSLKLGIHFLCVVRSLREGNFHLYIQALQKIAHLMFALDHPNNARWLPVHIRDMMLLEECHLDVAAEFKKGISLDHAHEQNNKLGNGDG